METHKEDYRSSSLCCLFLWVETRSEDYRPSSWFCSCAIKIELLCSSYDTLYPLKWHYLDRRRHFFFASLYKTTVMGPKAQSEVLCSLSPWTRLKRRINRGVRHHALGTKCALYSILHSYLIWYPQGMYNKFTSKGLRSLRTWPTRLRAN
jgi:hypothetical protein